jgi:hypothetical protein
MATQTLYDALNELSGVFGTGGYPIAYTIDPESLVGSSGSTGNGEIGAASQEMRGAAFIVSRPCTTTDVGWIVTIASAGTHSNFSGFTLFSLNTAGDWVFIANSGASAGAGMSNSTGIFSMKWRDSGDTVNQSYPLIPGVVYFVTYTEGTFTGSQPKIAAAVFASSAANIQMNNGVSSPIFRTAKATSSIAAKRSTNLTRANQTQVADPPFIFLYGTVP